MLTRRPRGFTLVELMVTIAVLGLLMLATLPSVGVWLRNAEIRTAAESLQSGLQKARAEAVRRNQPVLFSLVKGANIGALDNDCALSTSSASWVVSLDDPSSKCAQSASAGANNAPHLIDKYAQGDGATHVSVAVLNEACDAAGTATQIAFDGYGRLATATIAAPIRCIEVSHANPDSHKMRLVIGMGGTLRMCDPAVAAPDPRTCNPS